MWFAVLGPLRVLREGREVALGGPQQRALLALLLAAGGRPVGLDDLVDGLWGQEPPDTALNVLYRNVGTLRRALEADLAAREAGRWLRRAAGGYQLVVDATSGDLLRFREHLARARTSAGQDRPVEAVEEYLRALRLWRGAAGAGIMPEVRARPVFVALDREFGAAVGEAAQHALAAGLPARVLPAVRLAAGREPLDELLQARLVQVLAATGRQDEARAVYRTVRDRLAEELGIDPGPELKAAAEGVPHQEAPPPGTTPPAYPPPAYAESAYAGVAKPAQLPAGPPFFAGRRAELEQLPVLDDDPDTATVRIIRGMGGVGKTALAVHWAHRAAHHHPDGQLYVNLRGFHHSEQAMSADEALRVLLAGLGVAAEEIPAALEARAALFRDRVAGRRMLLLLDNARDADQVRPLLAAATGCLVIVTSRDRLDGLVLDGSARTITLAPLPADEAAGLLRARLGAERVDAEPDAVAQLLSLCGGLPLALAIVTAHALTHPSFTLASIAAELRRERGSLDAFTGFDPMAAPRAVFSWSYHALTPGAARLFRLLGTVPGPDISASAAASLGGVRPREVRPLLAELTAAHLLTEHVRGRYFFHDLVRAYAAGTAAEQDTDADRRAALLRFLDHYLRTARRCSELMKPGQNVLPPPEPRAGVSPDRVGDTVAASAWFSAEESVVLAAVEHAAQLGLDHHVAHLAWSAHTYLILLRPAQSALALARIAVRATVRLGDASMHAHALHALASACTRADLPGQAHANYQEALRLFTELGDVRSQAVTHLELTRLYDKQGRFPEALHHARRSLELSRQDGAGLFEQSGALNAVGWVLIRLGEPRAALAYSRRSLALHTGIGSVIGQSFNLYTMGWAYQSLGEHRAAIDSYRRSLAVGGGRGWHGRDHDALVLERLGDALDATGDRAAARASWRAALERLYASRTEARAALAAKLADRR
ncbi:BTAD domain-containing putative transcriptional regulator [Nonomuraea monospora]|uniref:BTAD domain-containing putative transcriptional regulator n=1 Tax=Nonomuraea monospora TaxID=568818 RepID=A0ABP5PQY9_9ACTN